MTDATPIAEPSRSGVGRRALMTGAAWALPVIALAVAAPRAAASTIDVGSYSLMGSCGVPGVVGPGFTLSGSATASLPVGTTVLITGSGVANIGVFSVRGDATATVTVLSGTSRLITLTSELPAGGTVSFRTTLSTTVAFTLNGVTTLPDGYAATGAKPSGSVTNTFAACSAN